jgi:hypothetical protein
MTCFARTARFVESRAPASLQSRPHRRGAGTEAAPDRAIAENPDSGESTRAHGAITAQTDLIVNERCQRVEQGNIRCAHGVVGQVCSVPKSD